MKSLKSIGFVMAAALILSGSLPAAASDTNEPRLTISATQGPTDGAFSAWTKALDNGKQIKFYVKYPQLGKKIQFLAAGSDGKYKQIGWFRLESSDLDSGGKYLNLQNDIYFIRTMTLKAGKNRVKILVDGKVVWGTKTYKPSTPSSNNSAGRIVAGTYLVGSQLPVGAYRVKRYWATLDRFGEILENDFIPDNGWGLMVLDGSEYSVELSGDAYPLAQKPVINPVTAGYTAGTYIVGVDVNPGTYRVTSASGAYISRLDCDGEIIENDFNTGNVTMTLESSDCYVQFSGGVLEPFDNPQTAVDPTTGRLGPGTWEVGTEVPPGLYRVSRYWSRLDANQEIIDNEVVTGRGWALVEILPSDAYVSISGEAYVLAAMPFLDPLASGFDDGTYIIGVDIDYGNYQVSDPSGAYAALLDCDFEIIDNEFVYGSIDVTIGSGACYFNYSGSLTAG